MKKRGEPVKHSKSKHAESSMTPKERIKASADRFYSHARGPVYSIKEDEKLLSRFFRKEEKKVAGEVRSEFRFLLSPQEFHVVSFVACLILLSFLFNSKSLILYSIFTVAVLAFAHFLKQHHRPHDVLAILGMFFMPIAATLAFFQDLLILLLLVVYALSAVSTVILYYYHKKEHALLKIMWQVTYSKMIALTLAVLVACLIPVFVLPDSFISIFELLFIGVLPVSFVFFFASKFFYLYFFDRRHIRHDLARSFHHTLIYTLSFMVLLACIYSLLAVSLYNSHMERYNANLDFALLDVSNMEKSMMKLSPDIGNLMVMRDLSGFAETVRENISLEKSIAMDRQIAFSDIMDDSYFSVIAEDVFSTVRFVVLNREIAMVKSALLELHSSVSEFVPYNVTFGDGDKSVDMYFSDLKGDVEGKYVPYSADANAEEVSSLLNDQSLSYSEFESQGFLYMFSSETGLTGMYGFDSVFERQMFMLIKHLEPVRQLTRTTVNIMLFSDRESIAASAIDHIYFNRLSDSIPLSAIMRYELLKVALDYGEDQFGDGRKLDFKID